MATQPRRVPACSATLLLALLAVPLASQEPRRTVPAAALEAQSILVAANPELRERTGQLAWRVEPTSTGVVVQAREVVAPFAPRPSTPVLVTAAVALDETRQLASIHVAGWLLDRAQRRAREATAGRETDVAIADALRAAGARFVPNSLEDVRTLVPAGLHRRLGPTVIRQTAFRARASDEGADAVLTWRVELDRQEAGGVLQRYTVVVEPLEGRLVSLVRR